MEKFSEMEIIHRIMQGEKAFYELIVKRYNPYLYKVGRSYNYNHDDTLDLMQETFIDAYKSLAKFENRSTFKTWIVRIMLNNCFRRSRKKSFKNEIYLESNETRMPMFTQPVIASDKALQNKELGSVIEHALENIAFPYRMVFSLREITGLNVAETAALLDISEANVKVRLNRAKTMLKEEIKKVYTPAEVFDFNLIYCDAMVDRVMNEINKL